MSDIQMISDDAKALARRLLEARAKQEELETAATNAKKERDELEAEVHQALVEAVGTSSLPLDLGPPFGRVRLNPVITVYGNVINEDKLQEYLENSAQVEEYTKPKLAMGEINKLARRLKETNESFPPGLDYRERKYVRVTVQK